jgi:hypothetical protein
MKSPERAFWTIVLPLAAALVSAAIFFGLFSAGMGMGVLDNYASFERIATPTFMVSLAWIPVCVVGVGVGLLRKWALKPYLLLGVGCVVPGLVFFAATSLLY